MKLKHKIGHMISISAAAFTICMMIYAAQPWGDNYAYKNFSDYLTLFGYALWAISPYLILTIIFQSFHKNQYSINVAFFGALIIVLTSCALLIDAFFVHIDAQNALVFLFLPICQWLAFLLLALMSFSIGKFFNRKT